MRFKTLILLALCAVFALSIAGCAQDSTNTTDDNPAEQELNMKGMDGASGSTGTSGTDTTREKATGGTDGTKLALVADPDGALKFNTTKLNAKAGDIEIVLTNESSMEHDVAVEDKSGKVLGKSDTVSGGEVTLKLKDVKPGTYTFYCTIPGHRQAGMEGTLTVR